MKQKLVSLPRYYVTHFINCCAPGDCPLPKFVDVTDMYVKVRVSDPDLSAIRQKAMKDRENHPSSTVRKSAQRTLDKLEQAGA